MSGKVTDKDLGFKKFQGKVQSAEYESFALGVFESDPEEVIKAAVHEFGSKHNPSRKWLSLFFDSHKNEIADIVKRATEAGLTELNSKEVFADFYFEEVLDLLSEYLESNPLSPPLTKEWVERKGSDTQMVDSGAMTAAVAVRLATKPSEEGSKGKEVARKGGGKGAGAKLSRKGVGGRKRGPGLLKRLLSLFRSLKGPALYEGYGQRKRAESKSMRSTTVQWPSGYKRMPVRSKGGQQPSDSRPKGK